MNFESMGPVALKGVHEHQLFQIRALDRGVTLEKNLFTVAVICARTESNAEPAQPRR